MKGWQTERPSPTLLICSARRKREVEAEQERRHPEVTGLLLRTTHTLWNTLRAAGPHHSDSEWEICFFCYHFYSKCICIGGLASLLQVAVSSHCVQCHTNVVFDPLIILRSQWFLRISVSALSLLLLLHLIYPSSLRPTDAPLRLRLLLLHLGRLTPFSRPANLKTPNKARGRREEGEMGWSWSMILPSFIRPFSQQPFQQPAGQWELLV